MTNTSDNKITSAELVDLLLDTPMVNWDRMIKSSLCDTPELLDATRRLENSIESMTRLCGYLNGRIESHEKGVKMSNSLVAKIRKALGYAYPKADISF